MRRTLVLLVHYAALSKALLNVAPIIDQIKRTGAFAYMNFTRLVTSFVFFKYLYTYASYCTVIVRIAHLSILLDTADLNIIFRK